MTTVILSGVSLLLIIYGFISFISGIKNDGRSFWTILSYDGLKDVFKKNYERYKNIVLGFVFFIAGIVMIVIYLLKK